MEEKELEAVQAENEEQKTEQQVEQKEEKKEKVEVKNEQPKELTDDELYAQIQTEKLLKKKKVKRIVTFSSLCLAFVLAVCLIVLAVLPVSLKPRCAVDGFTTIELYHSTQTLDPDIVNAFNNTDLRKDKFDLFMEKYNESFKTSYCLSLSFVFAAKSLICPQFSMEVCLVTQLMRQSHAQKIRARLKRNLRKHIFLAP